MAESSKGRQEAHCGRVRAGSQPWLATVRDRRPQAGGGKNDPHLKDKGCTPPGQAATRAPASVPAGCAPGPEHWPSRGKPEKGHKTRWFPGLDRRLKKETKSGATKMKIQSNDTAEWCQSNR